MYLHGESLLTIGMAIQESKNRPPMPRSIRQKQILDTAAEHPDASIDTIASEIPSATADLVEEVLEEYGDPAEEQSAETPDGEDTSTTTNVTPDLSSKQRSVLRAIVEHPDATQRELADALGISAATVNNRVNSITGFTWDDRLAFASTVFDSESLPVAEDPPSPGASDTERASRDDRLADRVAAVEREVDRLADVNGSRSISVDPGLTHKVLHACLTSDAITEEEELQILKSLLDGDGLSARQH